MRLDLNTFGDVTFDNFRDARLKINTFNKLMCPFAQKDYFYYVSLFGKFIILDPTNLAI